MTNQAAELGSDTKADLGATPQQADDDLNVTPSPADDAATQAASDPTQNMQGGAGDKGAEGEGADKPKDAPATEDDAAVIGGQGRDEEAEGEHEDEEEEEDEEDDDDEDDEDDDEDDEEDEEPSLKFSRLTPHLNAVYRNGDATSAFLVAGDKMIIGTHNGNIVRRLSHHVHT